MGYKNQTQKLRVMSCKELNHHFIINLKKYMGTTIKFFIFTALLILSTGCGKVVETIYLQKIKLNGQIPQTPVRLTDSLSRQKDVVISPHFSFISTKSINGRVEEHTTVAPSGKYRVDTVRSSDGRYSFTPSKENKYSFNGQNLFWEIPQYLAGFDLDVRLSKSFALALGLTHSADSKNSYLGGTFGFGLFGIEGNHGLRLDAGIVWQNLSYDAATVVVTEYTSYFSADKTTYVSFYRDKGSSTNINFYTNLTYNSAYTDLPINFFLKIGFFTQTLVNFEPDRPDEEHYPFLLYDVYRVDARGESMATYAEINPGIYLNLSENSRVIIGTRILYLTGLEDASKTTFISPMMQFDMRF